MVSPSSSLLDLSDNDEGEHEYQDHPGDYSTRMDELFADQSEEDEENSLSHSPRSEGVEVTKATYREQLRDVLGSETTRDDDGADDLDHSSSHGNPGSDDEHPARSTSDPQRPVSHTTPDIHTNILNTLSNILRQFMSNMPKPRYQTRHPQHHPRPFHQTGSPPLSLHSRI